MTLSLFLFLCLLNIMFMNIIGSCIEFNFGKNKLITCEKIYFVFVCSRPLNSKIHVFSGNGSPTVEQGLL